MLDSIQTGRIGTVVGTGEPGHSGDGCPAVAACLNEPKNIAFDLAGNLYIADSENHLIRKVDCGSGHITTVAGRCIEAEPEPANQTSAERPLAEPPEEDPLADPDQSPVGSYTQTPDISGMVRYIAGSKAEASQFSGDGGPAVQARLNFPSAMALGQDGVLFIADTWNHRIRRVDPITGTISTIAGTGQAKFSGDGEPAASAALNEPVALVLNNQGHLYIADQSNNRIRMIDLTTGVITTVAGNGESDYTGDGMAAVEAGLSGPSGLALDGEGNLYVSDTFNGRIRKIGSGTGSIETVLGDGREFRYQPGVNESSRSLSRPYGMTLDRDGHVLITDSDNHLIRKWDKDKETMTLVAGNGMAQFGGDGGPPERSSLNFPFGVAVSPQGQIYIADTFNHRIRMIASS